MILTSPLLSPQQTEGSGSYNRCTIHLYVYFLCIREILQLVINVKGLKELSLLWCSKMRPLWSKVREFIVDKFGLPNMCSHLGNIENEEMDMATKVP